MNSHRSPGEKEVSTGSKFWKKKAGLLRTGSERRARADKREKGKQAKGTAWMSLVRPGESFDLCGGSKWLLGPSGKPRAGWA